VSAAAKGVNYEDVPGFCKSVSLDEIRSGGYALTPGRYVGAPATVDDAEPVDDKIARLTKDLLEALDESARLDVVVREQVERLR
jgi:type I restriction enzyme M protein